MPCIKLLPDVLVNQIAAGEVIERPVSVVKELVENALDAAATAIDVDIEEGGTRLIRVMDNGRGMEKDDLMLALCRHATSKIASLEDLQDVRSMGFRGEALSSIASVAKVSLASRAQGSDLGWVVDAEHTPAGPFLARPHAVQQGTAIEVRELFFATPARKKFLRSTRTEFLQIQSLMRRLALSQPSVALRLTHDRRQIFRYAAGSRETRATQVLGHKFLGAALPFAGSNELLHVEGWIMPPEHTVRRGLDQFMYLNGRIIRDRQLLHALHRAWDEQGRGGPLSYVLSIDMQPNEFDINVHPAKAEVRFNQARMVHDFVLSVVKQALAVTRTTVPKPPTFVSEQVLSYGCRKVAGTPAAGGRYDDMHRPLTTAPRVTSHTLEELHATRFGIPRLLLFEQYLVTDCPSHMGIIDMDMAVLELLLAEVSLSQDRQFLRTVPLLLPIQFARQARLYDSLSPWEMLLNECGFQLRLGEPMTVTCLRVPEVLRGVDVGDVVPRLLNSPFAAIESKDASRRPEAIRFLLTTVARSAIRSHASAGLSWFSACLWTLEKRSSATDRQPAFWRCMGPEALDSLFGNDVTSES